MASLRTVAKRLLPGRLVEEYRRRRALRNFMSELSRELYDRQMKLHVEEIEGSVLARRPDITDRLFKDLLTRTDLLLQKLDRRIEGVQARHGADLRALHEQVAAAWGELNVIRDDLVALRRSVESLRDGMAAYQGAPSSSAKD